MTGMAKSTSATSRVEPKNKSRRLEARDARFDETNLDELAFKIKIV
jgi:hypothetical protein